MRYRGQAFELADRGRRRPGPGRARRALRRRARAPLRLPRPRRRGRAGHDPRGPGRPGPGAAPGGRGERRGSSAAGARARFDGEWVEAEVLRGEPEPGIEAAGRASSSCPRRRWCSRRGWERRGGRRRNDRRRAGGPGRDGARRGDRAGAGRARRDSPPAAVAGRRAADRRRPGRAGRRLPVAGRARRRRATRPRSGCSAAATLIAPTDVLTAAHCVVGLDPATISTSSRAASSSSDPAGSSGSTIARYSAASRQADVALDRARASRSRSSRWPSRPRRTPRCSRPGTPAHGDRLGDDARRTAGTGPTTCARSRSRSSPTRPASAAYDGESAEASSPGSRSAPAPQGRDSCSGDSGGPLLVRDDAGRTAPGRRRRATGAAAARARFPGVYAEVPALLDFIADPDPVYAPVPERGRGEDRRHSRVGKRLRCATGPLDRRGRSSSDYALVRRAIGRRPREPRADTSSPGPKLAGKRVDLHRDRGRTTAAIVSLISFGVRIHGKGRSDGGLDPVTLQVMIGGLRAACDEMGAVLIRSAHSANIKERHDCSTALFDADGELVMQAEHIPVHLGSMPEAVGAVLGEEHAPGDLWVLNDPYRGGTHLPDITLISPVFAGADDGRRAARVLGEPRPPRRHRRPDAGRDAGGLAHARGGGRRDPADPGGRGRSRGVRRARCETRRSGSPTCAPSAPRT